MKGKHLKHCILYFKKIIINDFSKIYSHKFCVMTGTMSWINSSTCSKCQQMGQNKKKTRKCQQFKNQRYGSSVIKTEQKYSRFNYLIKT